MSVWHTFRLTAAFLCVAAVLAEAPKDRAAALYRQKKFVEAARVLQPHVEANPGDLSSRLLLGLCLQLAGELGRAEGVFLATAQSNPRSGVAHYYLARVQFLRAKFAEAESNARLSMQLGESKARGFNLIGLVRAEQSLNEAALEAYREAIAADPKGLADPYLNAGTVLLKMDRPEDALERLNSAVSMDPRSAESLYQRARAHLELGARKAAEKDLAAALSVANHDAARRLLAQLRSGGVAGAEARSAAASVPVPIRFRNVAQPGGLRFTLENRPTPRKHLIETMAGGVAAFDFNNDGRVDIFFTNGAAIPSLKKDDPKYFNRLFRNDGGMRFTDVTAEAGIAGAGYSIGAAAADFDNDGYADLFVAGVNRNLLYRNLGNGKFEDVTQKAGIQDEIWSVAGGWLDYDNDGLLDLFVVNYMKWTPDFDRFCGDPSAKFRVYCHPKHFQGLPNRLYRNRGDGAFEDVSAKAGIAKHIGKGMSVAFADYDLDGWLDIFVTNDTVPNFLFRNRGDGGFEEVALAAGVALNDDGKAVSSMGADFRDFDNDGLADVIVTALAGETFPLFRNQGKGFFRDSTYPSRVGLLSAKRSGWSVGFFDFNNDGWKDIFTANSHVTDNIEVYSPDRYKQSNSVFLNSGNGTFQDATAAAGDDFQVPRAHRGSAFADFNGDGRIDVVVTSLGEPAELWENTSAEANGWIVLDLEGTRSNRDGIGARVRLNGQSNHMTTSVGYASSSRAGLHFGTGNAATLRRIEIVWPSGTVQVLNNVKTGQVLKVREPGR